MCIRDRFDCGEGTQLALKKAGFTSKPIDVICISHFHADHVSGLAGLLLTMGNEGRELPVTILIPMNGEHIIHSLLVIAPDIPFDINIREMHGGDSYAPEFMENVTIEAASAEHTVPCLAYSVKIKRNGKFDPVRAAANNVPQSLWNIIRRNGTAEYSGKVFTSSDIMGKERKGLKITYITDTRPCVHFAEFAGNSDLLICEGTVSYTHLDVYKRQVVDALNKEGKYPIYVTHGTEYVPEWVENLDAVNGRDEDAVVKAISETDIMATALGVNILPFVAPLIAKAIAERMKKDARPLNILICENLIGSNTYPVSYTHLEVRLISADGRAAEIRIR